MTRAEVAAESLCEAGYVDEAKYADLVRLMDVFFKDVAREVKESEREACATLAFNIAADEERCMGACERVGFAIRARSTK